MKYKQIGFESTLTREDYRSAVYFNTLFRKKGQCTFWVASGIVSALVLAVFFVGLWQVPLYLVISSGAFLVLLVLYFIFMEVNVRQFIASDKISVGSIREFAVFEDSIVVSGGKGRFRDEFRWKVFYKAYELRDFFLLYLNTQQAIIIPKRDVAAKDIDPIRKIFKAGLGDKMKNMDKKTKPAPSAKGGVEQMDQKK